MRVLYLTNNPNLGGTARILQSWLTLGRGEGLTARVAAQTEGDFATWLGKNEFEHLVDPMPLPDRRWPFPALWHAWKVAQWARRGGVDVIHCNEHDIYPFARLLRSLLRRPIVCHVRFRIERPYCEWAFGGRRRPDALMWTSHQQKADCKAAVEGIVPEALQHVVPLGLDTNVFGIHAAGRDATRKGWKAGPDDIVVGTAGALRPIKRPEDFVELASRLSSRHSNLRFVLAGGVKPGDEPYGKALEQKILSTALGDRFRCLGYLEPIEPFMHAVDIFVSTSEYETFGNSVCEAMACRRPVVAYRGGSVHEVVGDTGRVVPTGDCTALETAVEELLTRPALRTELGDRARQRVVECFNPHRTLQRMIAIYATLTS